jgi:hypothetical protein
MHNAAAFRIINISPSVIERNFKAWLSTLLAAPRQAGQALNRYGVLYVRAGKYSKRIAFSGFVTCLDESRETA